MATRPVRDNSAKPETWVAIQTETGFRVYNPGNPGTVFDVTGTQQAPQCTCAEANGNGRTPGVRCGHIQAVEQQLPAGEPEPDEIPYAPEEHSVSSRDDSAENGSGRPGMALDLPQAQLRIKRSVSPDGRIDSLSVEVSQFLDGGEGGEVHEDAKRILLLQERIVGQFLAERNGNGHGSDNGDREDAVDAKLLNVAGMKTKWGWRLFLNVQVNGDTVKMFGRTEQLVDAIRSAGFPDVAKRRLTEGMKLDLPCRVVTSQSDDGRYVRIDEVLPAVQARAPR